MEATLIARLGSEPVVPTTIDSTRRSPLSVLSCAERKVARLIAEGLTNRQIGERLYISPRTVDTHVAHLFTKLGVNTRVRVALAVAADPLFGA